MQVRIIRPSKSPMQSGSGDNMWHITGIRKLDSRSHCKNIGWVSSTSMDQEIDIKFPTQEEAMKFAENNLLEYEIIDTIQNSAPQKSYSSNFQRSDS